MSILLLVLAACCLASFTMIARSRWGSVIAVPAVATFFLLAIVAVLTVTPALGLHVGLTILVLLAVANAIGVTLLVRNPSLRARPGIPSLALWLPALLGAAIWLIARFVAQFLPGAAWLSWSMEGDTVNYLLNARWIITDHGIAIGSGVINAVPVPASLLALPMSLDRLFTAPGDTLQLDITIYGWVWTLALAAGCVAMGAVVASAIPHTRPVTVSIASALGSLLPLTWLVSGLPIDFGFFNLPIAIPIALASWLLFLGAKRSPLVVVTALLGVATLLLLTWSPVLLIPMALALVIVVRDRRRFLALRGVRLVVLILAVAAPAFYGVALTLPVYLEQGRSFQAVGVGFPITWVLVSAVGCCGLLAAAALRTRTTLPVFTGYLALIAAVYVGAAGLLYVTRDLFNPWTAYYPVKFAWLSTVILLPVALSLVAGRLALIAHRRVAVVAVAVVAAAVVVFAAVVPLARAFGYEVIQPLDKMLGGKVWNTGDDAVATILQLSRRHEVDILWHTTSPDEGVINFWVMDAAGEQVGGNEVLRTFAYSDYSAFRQFNAHIPSSEKALCAVLRDPSISAVIYTDDPRLETTFADSCAGGTARFVVGATPGIDD